MCGFIGVFGPEGVDVAPEIYEGLLAIQHRGQDAAGITTFTDTFHVRKGQGLVRDVFRADDMEILRGNLGVGHVRYPTIGVGKNEDAQPFHLSFPVGIAMAHNGNVTNFAELSRKLGPNTGMRLNSSCDLELVLFVFAKALVRELKDGELVNADHIFAAVRAVHEEVKGAYSVCAVLPDVGMVAFRDPFGIKPIAVGTRTTEEGTFHAVASESVVLAVSGYTPQDDMPAGGAVFIDMAGEMHSRVVTKKEHRPCIFEWVYFARPDSMLDSISVYKTRIRFGQALAKEWKESGAPIPDVVIPIPDSSRDAAMAMASALGVPYREGLVKNRYIGRTFIMPSQKSRQHSLKRKLNTIELEFRGKNVLLVDDSIVRGNTARRIVGMAREAGALKVYFAISSPPLIHPCPYGIDMATKTEFVASGLDNDGIAAALEVDHVLYLDREAMNEAAHVGNPSVEKFCNACFNGEYPTGDITGEVLDSIASERTTSRQKTLHFSG